MWEVGKVVGDRLQFWEVEKVAGFLGQIMGGVWVS